MEDIPPYPIDPFYEQPKNEKVENYSNWTIVKAVQFGIFSRVEELIEPKNPHITPYNVNEFDDEGVSLLHWAAINNRLAISRYLLDKGAIIDRRGGHLAATPLHWAVRQSHLSMVHFLIQRGANPLTMDNTGLTCMHVAAQTGSVPIIIYLLAYGIDADLRDKNGLTVLMVACMYVRSIDIFRLLVLWGADMSLTDICGNTVAHYAVTYANFQAILQFDKCGINWNVANHENKLPYQVRKSCWLTERVRQMTLTQQNELNAKSMPSKFNCRKIVKLHHSSLWRYRIIMALPPILIFVVCFILNWNIGLTLYSVGLTANPESLSSRLNFVLKLIVFVIVGVASRFVIRTFSDNRSQAISMISLAASLKFFLTLTYFFQIVPYTSTTMWCHFWFVIFITLLWITFYLCVTSDPGYINATDLSPEQRHQTILNLVDKSVARQMEATDGDRPANGRETNPLGFFCTTCFVHKPLRSKHCATCDRCVAKFDHHCPWIYNCVGALNHVYFIGYLFATSMSCILFVGGVIAYWRSNFACMWHGAAQLDESSIITITRYLLCSPHLTFCVINASLYGFWTILLLGSQMYQTLWLNATTNERINMDRYFEFSTTADNKPSDCNHSKRSTHNNPYDRGVRCNLLDLLGMAGYVHKHRKTDWRAVFNLDDVRATRSRHEHSTTNV